MNGAKLKRTKRMMKQQMKWGLTMRLWDIMQLKPCSSNGSSSSNYNNKNIISNKGNRRSCNMCIKFNSNNL